MGESFSKKEKAKKKQKEKQEKAEKMRERKANNTKGKSLEDMMAYVDEFGNISDTPPKTKDITTEISLEDIQLGAAPVLEESAQRKGTVSFFNKDKGYGFIIDNKTGENVFVHGNQLSEPVKEKDKVTFERERTQRGYSAINVKKV